MRWRLPGPQLAAQTASDAGEVGFGTGGEGGGLFVADVHPFDGAVFAQGVGEAVERVAGEAVDALDACVLQTFDH